MGSESTKEIRRGGLASVSRILKELSGSRGWSRRLVRAKVWEVWEEVVGPEVSKMAWPLRFQKGDCLVVAVADSVWMQQLAFEKELIVQGINRHLPPEAALKDIRLVMGEVEMSPHYKEILENKAQKDACFSEEELNRARERFSRIEDPELREVMMRLYLRCSGSRVQKKGGQDS